MRACGTKSCANCRAASVSLVDLGFIAGGPPSARDWPEDAIAVGHSLGLLWLLEQDRPFRALVSIQGFDCFSCHVAPSRVASMRQALARDAAATLAAFWRACGTADFRGRRKPSKWRASIKASTG